MTGERRDISALWREIEQVGSIEAYVRQQLEANGFLVERRDTDSMSARERDRYKKELKAEAKEKRKLARDAWAAYQSAHIVHLGEGVFWNELHDYDKWDLDDAEERAAENQLPPLRSPKDLANLLELTIPELRWLTYHREAATHIHYRRFTIPKRSGGERAIWAPLPKLKRAQRTILREIVERLPMHGAAHGFLPGKSVLTNARKHTGSRILLNLDLQDFFPTITIRRVRGLFRKAGYREQIATLLALLCTAPPREVIQHDGKTWYIAMGPRCLPQGAPTSPSISNAICLRLDRRLTGLAQTNDWRYSRYADDLTFSLPSTHSEVPRTGMMMGQIRRIIEDEGFSLNTMKTRVLRQGGSQRVTGLVVNGESPPRTPRKTRRAVRAALHNLKNGKDLPPGETSATVAGRIAWIQMSQPELGQQLQRELDAITAGQSGE